ncbi:MAG: hypothetical protein IPF98_12705 [Gemmatimonadetes bacterium]|nr:hypothetical protein [Gemmatimonadota bacterium]MCC6771475.1 hypothetical protein [Gemmatimonadaceae bacterium]
MSHAGGLTHAFGVTARRGSRSLAIIALVASVLLTAGCAGRRPNPLLATSVGAPVHVSGDFVGTVTLDADVLTLQLERARVRYLGWAAGDAAAVEGVTLRAVVAADSSGRGIPLGVSSALPVAEVMRVGDVRTLDGTVLVVPIPPGQPARDLWIAFQFRGTVHARDREPVLLIAYACSAQNLIGSSKSAKARASRMRASYTVGCAL